MSSESLTPTSYLVLGLLAQDGPSTPYALKQAAAATLGNFWSFPHTQLYTEPARLAELGLVTETRERGGRRRRVFTVTDDGRRALADWLAAPAGTSVEIRDVGLLQLFFAGSGSADDRARIAVAQERRHAAKLAGYEALQARIGETAAAGKLSEHERWRVTTLRMGLAYETAAVAFWREIAAEVAAERN